MYAGFDDVDGQRNKNVFPNCELMLNMEQHNTALETELTPDKNRIFFFLFCPVFRSLYLYKWENHNYRKHCISNNVE